VVPDWTSPAPGLHIDGDASYSAYATSTEWVHWDRLNLGVLELTGRRDYSVVLVSDGVEARYLAQGKKRLFVLLCSIRVPAMKVKNTSV
jgi:hypothetical protein